MFKQKQISLVHPDGSFCTAVAFDNRELCYLHLSFLEKFRKGDKIEIRDMKNPIPDPLAK